MSKPLELTIYPPVSRFTRELIDYNIEQGQDAYFGISAEMHAPGLLAMAAKRLTEAELAAEWWRSDQNFHNSTDGTESGRRALAESITVHRFATHPHYFEATEPESDTE